MTLANITAPVVLAVLVEFDRLGREEFLRTTGFGWLRLYFLIHDGRLYDSKAIAGGVSTGATLGPAEFSGGEKTVMPVLEALGFTVRYIPRQDWTRDEIILACALIEPWGWRQLDRTDLRVAELSSLLQTRTTYPPEQRGPDFRTPASVLRKMADIATSHPAYAGQAANATDSTAKCWKSSWRGRPRCTRSLQLSVTPSYRRRRMRQCLTRMSRIRSQTRAAFSCASTCDVSAIRRSGETRSLMRRSAGLRSPARYATSTSPRPTDSEASTTSSATTECRCTLAVRPGPGSKTSRLFTEWGWLHLTGAIVEAGTGWTDSGTSVEERGLKHRADAAVRDVPVPPAEPFGRHTAGQTGGRGGVFVDRVYARGIRGTYGTASEIKRHRVRLSETHERGPRPASLLHVITRGQVP
ncbi:HNH endonuclease [Actinoplanes sp. N902-109]|nr:HNH endonuclease [Actinoplanes sp. N902-109]